MYRKFIIFVLVLIRFKTSPKALRNFNNHNILLKTSRIVAPIRIYDAVKSKQKSIRPRFFVKRGYKNVSEYDIYKKMKVILHNYIDRFFQNETSTFLMQQPFLNLSNYDLKFLLNIAKVYQAELENSLKQRIPNKIKDKDSSKDALDYLTGVSAILRPDAATNMEGNLKIIPKTPKKNKKNRSYDVNYTKKNDMKRVENTSSINNLTLEQSRKDFENKDHLINMLVDNNKSETRILALNIVNTKQRIDKQGKTNSKEGITLSKKLTEYEEIGNMTIKVGKHFTKEVPYNVKYFANIGIRIKIPVQVVFKITISPNRTFEEADIISVQYKEMIENYAPNVSSVILIPKLLNSNEFYKTNENGISFNERIPNNKSQPIYEIIKTILSLKNTFPESAYSWKPLTLLNVIHRIYMELPLLFSAAVVYWSLYLLLPLFFKVARNLPLKKNNIQDYAYDRLPTEETESSTESLVYINFMESAPIINSRISELTSNSKALKHRYNPPKIPKYFSDQTVGEYLQHRKHHIKNERKSVKLSVP